MAVQTPMPEMPIIRPPSEWRSLLVRVTRGCRWNRCRFCGIYPHLGAPEFSVRTVDEVKRDIDLLRRLRPRAETAFLGDADPLEAGVDAFLEIARYLRRAVSVRRLTCYARAATLHKLKRQAIMDLAAAGLDRVHIGLESGSDAILRFHRKGQSADMVRQVADWLHEAGIEISFYVLLGLGGANQWQQHIRETARVINDTAPHFVRIRRLWLYDNGSGMPDSECPLWQQIRAGDFVPQTDEGTVHELRLLVSLLAAGDTFFACDHENNFVQVSGVLKQDREEMLAEIDAFLSLPAEARQVHYQEVGSRI
ncbi:MAG: radical SAM protein [Pseudomonadota bacterium]